MSDFLAEMAAASAARAAGVKRRYSDDQLDLPLLPLSLQGFSVIAELKEYSPAEGALAGADNDRLAQASRYVAGGAAAVSVLTEPTRFGGDIAHLSEVAALLAGAGIPAMRKDFLVDTVQVIEARAAGASGVLLITAILDDDRLHAMLDCAFDHSLFVLLEAFDENDLQRTRELLQHARYADAARADGLLVGVNTRDLRTLAVDVARLERLRGQLPEGARYIAESGIASAADAAQAARLGYHGALVGSALMRSADPAGLIRDMRAVGRDEYAA